MREVEIDPEVFQAFSCRGPAQPLIGGEGQSVRVGDCVLKPIDNPARYTWASELILRMTEAGFRLARPRRATNGTFVVRGWGAASYEPGEHQSGRWEDKLQVVRRFHTELNKQKPTPMPPGEDVWSQAHELAWETASLPTGLHPETRKQVNALFAQYQPLPNGEKIIHADLSGNILFHDKLAPCVIDFSPAYGSTAYAKAIIAADAIAWEGAPWEILDLIPYSERFRQHLLRAINFRLLVPALREPGNTKPFNREYAAFKLLIDFITTKHPGLAPIN